MSCSVHLIKTRAQGHKFTNCKEMSRTFTREASGYKKRIHFWKAELCEAMAPFGDMRGFVTPAVTETAFPSRWTGELLVVQWCMLHLHGLLGLNDEWYFMTHVRPICRSSSQPSHRAARAILVACGMLSYGCERGVGQTNTQGNTGMLIIPRCPA